MIHVFGRLLRWAEAAVSKCGPRVRGAGPAILLAGLLVASLVGPTSVAAHDDPPGHYLETDLLYPAIGDRPSQATELALIGLLQASADAGYPIRVALLANETDVEDPAMVGQPQAYAEAIVADIAFELGRPVDGPVLVVSPVGFGLAGQQDRDGARRPVSSAAAVTLLAGLTTPSPATGEGLALAAMAAVRQVARLGGHELPATVPPAQATYEGPTRVRSDGVDLVPIVVFAGLFLAMWGGYEFATRRSRPREEASGG